MNKNIEKATKMKVTSVNGHVMTDDEIRVLASVLLIDMRKQMLIKKQRRR